MWTFDSFLVNKFSSYVIQFLWHHKRSNRGVKEPCVLFIIKEPSIESMSRPKRWAISIKAPLERQNERLTLYTYKAILEITRSRRTFSILNHRHHLWGICVTILVFICESPTYYRHSLVLLQPLISLAPHFIICTLGCHFFNGTVHS